MLFKHLMVDQVLLHIAMMTMGPSLALRNHIVIACLILLCQQYIIIYVTVVIHRWFLGRAIVLSYCIWCSLLRSTVRLRLVDLIGDWHICGPACWLLIDLRLLLLLFLTASLYHTRQMDGLHECRVSSWIFWIWSEKIMLLHLVFTSGRIPFYWRIGAAWEHVLIIITSILRLYFLLAWLRWQ